ncbi:multiple sugar transport system permease protein [Pseudobutyrivibrio ruminis]|uniref:Multiple sugar transport system permease protein n=2 Tax=Pseudobutyrivibrio ruminis TaxID=46206 RepID=A0A1H7L242_9FIRM|nr:carbohydrate ABC transporter permease [Pseudobutyrivibrio ruminis]SEK92337.1 multiple sugar transport system permease protein [Pseudobutyrivibrio ruminis]SOC11973.1 multiple sugar transport system permease protein [Pseudobutyrivibrio ruminis DSM 9787]
MKHEKRENAISFGVGFIIFVILMFPLYWMLVTSLKTQVEIFQVPTPLWPKNLTFEAFQSQFSETSSTMKGFKNSFLIAFSAMAISTILSIPAAYGLARFRFNSKKLLILFFLMMQMLPSTLILTPLYIMFSKMGLLNNYLAPILADATLGIPFSIIILRTYFLSIPKELDEAAAIDGCNPVTSFFKIMLPIAKPGVIVAAVFSFVYAWGDLIYGITFMTDPNMRPITSNIYNYVQQYQTLWNATMAFGLVAIFPIVLIFIFMQKYIVSGLTNGAVKA